MLQFWPDWFCFASLFACVGLVVNAFSLLFGDWLQWVCFFLVAGLLFLLFFVVLIDRAGFDYSCVI